MRKKSTKLEALLAAPNATVWRRFQGLAAGWQEAAQTCRQHVRNLCGHSLLQRQMVHVDGGRVSQHGGQGRSGKGKEQRRWVVDEMTGETTRWGLPQQIGPLGYIGERQDAHVLTIQAGPGRTFCFPLPLLLNA